MFFLLLFAFLLVCRENLSYSVNHEAAKKNDLMIEHILSSYIKPIKQLTANFPNHKVEFQIEFQKPTKRTPQRRFILYRPKQNNKRRSDNMETDPFDVGPGIPNKVPTTAPSTVVTQQTTTLTPIAPSTTEYIETTRTKRVRTTTFTEITERNPVYLEDLRKIFDEFADKIKSTHCNSEHATTNEYPPQIVIANPGPVHSNRNINEVVELIRKGVHVKKHVPRPTDEDLDWLQIKIPV